MSGSPDTSPQRRLDKVQSRPGGRSARTRRAVLEAARQTLLEDGYPALSRRAVARRAGVDPSTVYRRWPTRAHLATDALLEIARTEVPFPDTGTVAGDLGLFVTNLAVVLGDLRLLRLFHALSAARAEADGELESILAGFWGTRFAGGEAMIERAVQRGELPAEADAHALIEHLVAPLYFRALVTGEPLDDRFVRSCADWTLAAAGGRAISGGSTGWRS